jgi:DNA-directed RNA polymerase II subunit RPB1
VCVLCSDLSCIATDDNAEKLVLRLRVINEAKSHTSGDDTAADDDDEGFLRRIESVYIA